MTSRNREGGVVTKNRQLGLPNPFEPSNSKSDDEVERPLKTKNWIPIKARFWFNIDSDQISIKMVEFSIKWDRFQLKWLINVRICLINWNIFDYLIKLYGKLVD